MKRQANDPAVAATRRLLPDQDSWIHWPIMPMKRWRDQTYEFGYIYGNMDPGQPPLVIRGGLLTDANENNPIVGQYQTIDELIADGWVVD